MSGRYGFHRDELYFVACAQGNGGLGNIGGWVIGQLLMTALALVWVWAVGLGFLWRSGRPLWRAG